MKCTDQNVQECIISSVLCKWYRFFLPASYLTSHPGLAHWLVKQQFQLRCSFYSSGSSDLLNITAQHLASIDTTPLLSHMDHWTLSGTTYQSRVSARDRRPIHTCTQLTNRNETCLFWIQDLTCLWERFGKRRRILCWLEIHRPHSSCTVLQFPAAGSCFVKMLNVWWPYNQYILFYVYI